MEREREDTMWRTFASTPRSAGGETGFKDAGGRSRWGRDPTHPNHSPLFSAIPCPSPSLSVYLFLSCMSASISEASAGTDVFWQMLILSWHISQDGMALVILIREREKERERGQRNMWFRKQKPFQLTKAISFSPFPSLASSGFIKC